MPPREIFREGVFDFQGATDLSNRCGITGQGLRYRYQVRLFADSLDGRGFILDNRAINAYWLFKYSTPEPKVLPSCEAMAEQACVDFVALAQLEGVALRGCEVRLYGGTHSAVTARWGNGVWTTATAVDPADTLVPVEEPLVDADRTLTNLLAVVNGWSASSAA